MVEEYLVLAKKSHETLTNTVNKYIQRGWEPIGGIAIKKGNMFEYYYQAIIRHDKS